MKYQVRYSELSLQDIGSIALFNSQFSQKFQKKVIDNLKTKIEALSKNPCKAPDYEYNPRFKKLIVMHYLVFYKVNDSEKIVEIHRVLHSARNVFDILDDK